MGDRFRVLMAGSDSADLSFVAKAMRMAMYTADPDDEDSLDTLCADEYVRAAYHEASEREDIMHMIRSNIKDYARILARRVLANPDRYSVSEAEMKMLQKIPPSDIPWYEFDATNADIIEKLWHSSPDSGEKGGPLKQVFTEIIEENSVDSCAAHFLPIAVKFSSRNARNELTATDVLLQREETKGATSSSLSFPPIYDSDMLSTEELLERKKTQTTVELMDLGQQMRKDKAKLDPTLVRFMEQARSCFVEVPIGDFDVRDLNGVDRVSAALSTLMDLLFKAAFRANKKTFVVVLTKLDVFEIKMKQRSIAETMSALAKSREFEKFDWKAQIDPLLARVQKEYNRESMKIFKCFRDDPDVAYKQRNAILVELLAVLSERYSGPEGDEKAVLDLFKRKVNKIFEAAKIVNRETSDHGDHGGRFTGMHEIVAETTGIDLLEELRRVLPEKVINKEILSVGLMNEVGMEGDEDEDEGPSSPVCNAVWRNDITGLQRLLSNMKAANGGRQFKEVAAALGC